MPGRIEVKGSAFASSIEAMLTNTGNIKDDLSTVCESISIIDSKWEGVAKEQWVMSLDMLVMEALETIDEYFALIGKMNDMGMELKSVMSKVENMVGVLTLL